MANNRMYIYCRVCRSHGEDATFFIGKHFGEEWYAPTRSPSNLESELSAWMAKHHYCMSEEPSTFGLSYENGNEYLAELPLSPKPESKQLK